MGNSESVWWIVVEFTCRILGVSTATVLCAVGVETLQHGEFNSLGIYLSVSSFCIMIFELAFFLEALLFMCLPYPPDWQLFMLWGKMARIGGFHKFLYYSIMSVVCFLHPVLVWHAIIPGVMLLITAIFNFILSKKGKTKSQESYNNQGLTTVSVSERAASNNTFSFYHMGFGRRGKGLALINRDCSNGPSERGESVQAMMDPEQTSTMKEGRLKDRRQTCLTVWEEPTEREMEVIGQHCEPEPDTTSDTAPMITD